MSELFVTARHVALAGEPWDERAARDAIVRITRAAHEAFDPRVMWPAHALDTEGSDDRAYYNVYFGAAGVMWALDRLARTGAIERGRSYAGLLADRIDENARFAAKGSPWSYWMGEAGMWMTEWRLSGDRAWLDHIARSIERNVDHPTRELTWGAAGTTLAAALLYEETNDHRFRELCTRGAEGLWDRWQGVLWTQELYGMSLHSIGAGHGFAGNALALYVARAQRARSIIERVERTLEATATIDGECASWHRYDEPIADDLREKLQPRAMLVQFCHGAPGIIVCLADMPSDRLDGLLIKGGELTWRAGPLKKGGGLCHGTAGNGYALLKLYERTGDRTWLDRARAFAMHAITQIDGARWSLWTGDLGIACFLWDCVRERAEVPTLDVF
jgi:hypothetical protein